MILSFVALLLLLNHVQGMGDFLFFPDSSCQLETGYRYIPAGYALQYPTWWDDRCLWVDGTAEHFSLSFNQSFNDPMSAYFRLQIWEPTIYCGFLFANTESDIFEVSSVGWPEITCREGTFTNINGTHTMSTSIWMTVVPDPSTQPSSTGLPPQPDSSSSITSSPIDDSSTTIPFPFDSSMLNPSGTVVPDSTGAAAGDESHSSVAMIAGIASGVAVVAIIIAVGAYCMIKRRRQARDQLPYVQDRASLSESLYSRNQRDSDY